MDSISIGVISDLHCRYGDNKGIAETQTFLTSELDLRPVNRHPIEALKHMISQNNIQADILLCPGDIADKIDKQGLLSGWRFIQDVQKSIKAKQLYATVGNHDADSRKTHMHPLPFDLIRQLSDNNFPTEKADANQKFWSDHFCIIEESSFIVLIFNSSYSHIDIENAKNCIIEQSTIDEMRETLNTIKEISDKFKICLLHHHPVQHSNFDLKFKDGDFVQNGDKLLDLLNEFSFDVVIHGHKHEPKLRYFNKLPLFASGSFSSLMNTVEIKADNTFHIIKLEKGKKGIIESWTYGPTKGWTQQDGTYFPCLTGFGSTKTIDEIAKNCADYLKASGETFVSYRQLVLHEENIKYIIPSEQVHFTSLLEKAYGLKIYPSVFTKPEIIIKNYT